MIGVIDEGWVVDDCVLFIFFQFYEYFIGCYRECVWL